ncbi:MAG: sodium:calcium antiporter [Brevinema sp.]
MLSLLWNHFFGVFFLLVLSVIAIVFIGRYLVLYADKLAAQLGISGGLVGYILVAAVTSIPELVSTFIAASNNFPALAAGNIFGSNAANIAFLSVVFLVTNQAMAKMNLEALAGLWASLAILVAVSLLYVLIVLGIISLGEVPLAGFIFVFYLLLMYLNYRVIDDDDVEAPEKGKGGLRGFFLFSVLIVGCSWALIHFCARMTQLPFPGLGRPLGQQFIGTLILAVATSVPEIVTTFVMVRRGYSEMAYGNIFGSNVFNLMIFCFAPLFAAQEFWKAIPFSMMYTALFVVAFSLILFFASKMHFIIQRLFLIGIFLMWIASLALVF